MTMKTTRADPQQMIYCPHIFAATGKQCRQPLGFLIPGEFSRQISTLDGTRVTSREDGGFYVHCPACGHGYFWHLTYCVPTEQVEEQLQAARSMNYKYVKFSGKSKRRVDNYHHS